ncbi:tetratricopeptide repeat protein [Neolewinella sp.]|uniref:tetratricopeptide repeat protein n=1 Tax=Neolewinella sp. TaxID=2993543 RepID=UPI003B520C55
MPRLDHYSLVRYWIAALACLLPCTASTQIILDVTQTIYFTPGTPRDGYYVGLSTPLASPRQGVTVITLSPAPTAVLEDSSFFEWQTPATDSVHLTYRIVANPLPEWGSPPAVTDTLRELADPATYVLPPLPRTEVGQTALGKAAREDVTATVERLLRVLRRTKAVRDPENFNLEQPLLEDFFRGQTTPRRKHELLSLGLQYHGIAHRLVSGKVLRFGTVLENQLWAEVQVNHRWSRIDLAERDDYLRENSVYLSCSYDYRNFSFTVVGPEVVDWRGEYQETLLKLWDAKDRALAKEDYPLALSYLDTVLQYAPKLLVAVAEKGLVVVQAGDTLTGMKYLQYVLNNAKQDDDKAMAYLQLAKYYALTEDTEQVLQALARSNTFAPLTLQVVYNDLRFTPLLENARLLRRLRDLYPEPTVYTEEE